jgi:hypothetical protein
MSNIGNPQFWERVGLFSTGAVLLLVVIILMLKDTQPVQAATSAAKGAAKGVLKTAAVAAVA